MENNSNQSIDLDYPRNHVVSLQAQLLANEILLLIVKLLHAAIIYHMQTIAKTFFILGMTFIMVSIVFLILIIISYVAIR